MWLGYISINIVSFITFSHNTKVYYSLEKILRSYEKYILNVPFRGANGFFENICIFSNARLNIFLRPYLHPTRNFSQQIGAIYYFEKVWKSTRILSQDKKKCAVNSFQRNKCNDFFYLYQNRPCPLLRFSDTSYSPYMCSLLLVFMQKT